MIEMLVTVAITMLVLAVVVPLTLLYLLVRQVRRSRAVRRLRAARASGRVRAPRVQAGGVPPLLRPWAKLAAEAGVARERFLRTVELTPAGPLRSRLTAVVAEVDAAVADARRLAQEGSNTERARREVLSALAQQLTTGAHAAYEARAASSLADHVAALREATAEVEALEARVRL